VLKYATKNQKDLVKYQSFKEFIEG
jgi:hypothetical protein